jgi:hypothetical protein
MAPQSNYAHSTYLQEPSNNIKNSNDMILPMIRENHTNTLLKSVHGTNMSSLIVNNHSHMRNNSFAHQNLTVTNNSRLHVDKQENGTYVLPASLNIWLTHGL